MEPTMMMSQNFQFIQACLRSCVVCIGDALEESRKRQRHVAVVVVEFFFRFPQRCASTGSARVFCTAQLEVSSRWLIMSERSHHHTNHSLLYQETRNLSHTSVLCNTYIIDTSLDTRRSHMQWLHSEHSRWVKCPNENVSKEIKRLFYSEGNINAKKSIRPFLLPFHLPSYNVIMDGGRHPKRKSRANIELCSFTYKGTSVREEIQLILVP